MSAVQIERKDLEDAVDQLKVLARNCTIQANRAAVNADAVDADASLAAKNWSGAALQAVQAWMTAARGPGR